LALLLLSCQSYRAYLGPVWIVRRFEVYHPKFTAKSAAVNFKSIDFRSMLQIINSVWLLLQICREIHRFEISTADFKSLQQNPKSTKND
jgi:hypothetical protein